MDKSLLFTMVKVDNTTYLIYMGVIVVAKIRYTCTKNKKLKIQRSKCNIGGDKISQKSHDDMKSTHGYSSNH